MAVGELTTAEREQLPRQRRGNTIAQGRAGTRSALRVEGEPSHSFGLGDVPIAAEFEEWLLRIVRPAEDRSGEFVHDVGRKRVARLMRADGFRRAALRRYMVTTLSDPRAKPEIDLVER